MIQRTGDTGLVLRPAAGGRTWRWHVPDFSGGPSDCRHAVRFASPELARRFHTRTNHARSIRLPQPNACGSTNEVARIYRKSCCVCIHDEPQSELVRPGVSRKSSLAHPGQMLVQDISSNEISSFCRVRRWRSQRFTDCDETRNQDEHQGHR